MGLKDFSYFSKKAQDWQATSYGDVGVAAGLGGGVKHLKLWSPSTNLTVNSLLLHGKAGAEIQIKSELLNIINGAIQNFLKGKESVTSEFNYKKLTCYTSFSIENYIGSLCAGFDEAVTIGVGKKVGGLKVSKPGVGPLFLIPPEVETMWGLGGGVSAFSGIVIGVGVQFFDYNMQQRYFREKARKPTDPVIRDPGGF